VGGGRGWGVLEGEVRGLPNERDEAITGKRQINLKKIKSGSQEKQTKHTEVAIQL